MIKTTVKRVQDTSNVTIND